MHEAFVRHWAIPQMAPKGFWPRFLIALEVLLKTAVIDVGK